MCYQKNSPDDTHGIIHDCYDNYINQKKVNETNQNLIMDFLITW